MNNRGEDEMKSDKIYGIIGGIIVAITSVIIISIMLIYFVPAMCAGYTMMFEKPSTYILPIAEKDLEDTHTKSGAMTAPYLYFVLDTGESVKVKVNADSYENVQVGDLIAIDVWEVFKGYSVVQLNTEYNNTVREKD